MTATPGQPLALPVTQKREFWVLMGYAMVLGVFGAFAGLIFVGAITFGGKWYSDSHPGWFGGHWWWVAVAAAAGVAVGLVRRLTRLPWKTPGLFEDLQTEHVDPKLVPGIAAVSLVSLIGGASLGPEKALGSMGGGAGSWIAQRRGLKTEDAQVNTLAGFAGAYGGLFSSTLIVVMLIMEAARPGAVVAAPFAMVLMAAFLTQVGALQTAPILIAVVTAFLTMEAVKYLLASRKQARAAAAKPGAGAKPATPG